MVASVAARRFLSLAQEVPPHPHPKGGRRSHPLTWRARCSLLAKYSGVFLITEAGSREGEMEGGGPKARDHPHPHTPGPRAAGSRSYLG